MDRYRQRTDINTCARCRLALAPGDRVTPAYIVQATHVRDPNTKELCALLGKDFELVHADCKNPKLDPQVIVVIT